MLSTNIPIRLEPISDCPPTAKLALTELDEVFNLLPLNNYEETKTFQSYDCLHDQLHFWGLKDLTDLEANVMPELNRFGVLSIDTEAQGGLLPEILSVQAMGGRQRIFHLHDLLESIDDSMTPRQKHFGDEPRKELRKHLGWLLDVIESRHFLKIGYNIQEQIDYMGHGMWAGNLPMANVLDVQVLYEYNQSRGMYRPDLLLDLGRHAGFGKLAVLHNQYDHCVYDRDTFLWYRLGDWQKFDVHRKEFKGARPWMFRWRPDNQFLLPKQKLFLYLNLATPLRMLVQAIWWAIQEQDIYVSKKADLFDAVDLLAGKAWPKDYLVRSRNNRKIKEAKKYFQAQKERREERKALEREERQKRASSDVEEKAEAELTQAFSGYPGPRPVATGLVPKGGKRKTGGVTPLATVPEEASTHYSDIGGAVDTLVEELASTGQDDSEMAEEQLGEAASAGALPHDSGAAGDLSGNESGKLVKSAPLVGTAEPSSGQVDAVGLVSDSLADEAVYQGEKIFGVYYHPKTDRMGYEDRGPVMLVNEDATAVMCYCEQSFSTLLELRNHHESDCNVMGGHVSMGQDAGDEPAEKKTKVDTGATDLTVKYKAEEEVIAEAVAKRHEIQLQPHHLDALLPDVSLFGRYVDPAKALLSKVDGDPGHKHFERNSSKRRNKLKNNILAVLSKRTQPEHVLEDSLFMATHCSDCGGKYHSPDTIQCPVARYHNGMKVLDHYTGAGFFTLFPCLFCESVLHTTVVCPELHSFCQHCWVRGHRPGQACRFKAAYKKKFDQYSRYGFRTYRAATDGARWSYKPLGDLDSVKSGYLSDTENKADFTTFILNTQK